VEDNHLNRLPCRPPTPAAACVSSPMKLPMLTPDDKLVEIRRLYFSTTKETIERDLAKALDLLKSMNSEDERERATVYMQGLNEMRTDWRRGRKGKTRK
jgi:hypothetical protein